MKRNIVLIAEGGSGKDFLGEYLIKNHGYKRYAFADDVKSVAQLYFPHLYGEEGKKPRELLQKVGTKMREIDSEVWIKSMMRDIDERDDMLKAFGWDSNPIVITDCRMPNEYKELKSRGYTFVRIISNDTVRRQRMLDRGDEFKKEDMNHHTESFYDGFVCDYKINNNGTPEELYKQIEDIISLLEEVD